VSALSHPNSIISYSKVLHGVQGLDQGSGRGVFYTRHLLLRPSGSPTPPRQTQPPFSRYMRHLRVEARSCMVRKDWIRGGSRGVPSATLPSPPLDKHNYPYMRHLRVESRSCMVCKDWIRGGSRGGNATKCTVRIVVTIVHLPRLTPPCGLRATARVHDRERRSKRGDERGEERMRDCDERMWTNGCPFICLSGHPVVTVLTASWASAVDGQFHAGIHAYSCFESNDVFKEYETTLTLKGQRDD
jgi:hypothetical protein